MLENNPTLKEFTFDISVNNLQMDYQAYWNLLRRCKLEKLQLGMCGLLMREPTYTKLVEYIGSTPTLKELRFNFRYNEINDESIKLLAVALGNCPNVELLHL